MKVVIISNDPIVASGLVSMVESWLVNDGADLEIERVSYRGAILEYRCISRSDMIIIHIDYFNKIPDMYLKQCENVVVYIDKPMPLISQCLSRLGIKVIDVDDDLNMELFGSEHGSKDYSSNKLDVNKLSSKKVELLMHLSEGRSNKEIAAIMSIAEGTVRNYLTNIYKECNVVNRVEATNLVKNWYRSYDIKKNFQIELTNFKGYI